MNITRILFSLSLALLFTRPAEATLTISLAGSPDSATVQYRIAGTFIAASSNGGASSSVLLLPTGPPSVATIWQVPEDTGMGDIYESSTTDLFATLSSPVQLLVNDSPVMDFEEVRLMKSFSPGADGIRLRNTSGTTAYPALVSGDEVRYEGNGTFTLPTGSFGSGFLSDGVFSADPTTYVLEINTVPAPTPLSMCLAGGAMAMCRRR